MYKKILNYNGNLRTKYYDYKLSNIDCQLKDNGSTPVL